MPFTFPIFSSGSMFVGPSLSGNPMLKYPLNSSGAWVTRVIRFLNDDEQSWTVRPALLRLQARYEGMNGYDTARLVEFFHSLKGRYVDDLLVRTFDFTYRGFTYKYCVFDQDDVEIEENVNCPLTFAFTLNIRQLRYS